MKFKLRDLIILFIVLGCVAVIATRSDASERKPRGADIDIGIKNVNGNANSNTNSNSNSNTLSAGAEASALMSGNSNNIAFDSKAYALAAPNLGDVDIAQCLGSTQWSLLVGGKQKLVLNHVCMAEFYLKTGRYDLAAQSLCNQPEIIMEYDDELACEADHDFTPPLTMVLPASTGAFEEHYELAQRQEEEIEYMQEEQATLVGRIEQLTQQIEEAPEQVVIREEVQTEYSDEQYEAVFMALKGSDEDE